jgi:hypothetical protein
VRTWAEDFAVVNPGAPDAAANAALSAAGTGLGEAGLYWDGTHYRPFASEGGHADFAPRFPLEVELCAFLVRQAELVSYEREEAWQIADPALPAGAPVYEYEPKNWGRARSIRKSHPPGG